MKYYLNIIILFLYILPTHAQSEFLVVKKNKDSLELSVLDQYISNKQIISLGEQTHLDGATFDIKVEIIKYLHQQHNFNVIAFESNFYELNKANDFLDKGKANILRKSLFGVWNKKAIQDLENYILETKKTNNPLNITGFDHQFSGSIAKEFLLKDLDNFISENNLNEILDGTDWTKFNKIIAKQIRISNKGKKLNKYEREFVNDILDRIISYLEKKDTLNPSQQKWFLTCKNIKIDIFHRLRRRGYRDENMAKNLIDLKEKFYSNEKIITWNATSHFIFNPHYINNNYYKSNIPMGAIVKEKYGDDLYTIAFTSAIGKYGYNILPLKLKKPEIGSIEDLMLGTNEDYLFIDSKSINSKRSRILGNRFMEMDVSKVVDAIFYIKESYIPLN